MATQFVLTNIAEGWCIVATVVVAVISRSNIM